MEEEEEEVCQNVPAKLSGVAWEFLVHHFKPIEELYIKYYGIKLEYESGVKSFTLSGESGEVVRHHMSFWCICAMSPSISGRGLKRALYSASVCWEKKE